MVVFRMKFGSMHLKYLNKFSEDLNVIIVIFSSLPLTFNPFFLQEFLSEDNYIIVVVKYRKWKSRLVSYAFISTDRDTDWVWHLLLLLLFSWILLCWHLSTRKTFETELLLTILGSNLWTLKANCKTVIWFIQGNQKPKEGKV